MATDAVTIRWGVATDVGRHRPVNQDSVLTEEPLWVVADGMGGHAAGEVASQLALITLRDVARPTGHIGRTAGPAAATPGAAPMPTTALVADAVRAANLAVLQRASADAALRGMGTTICGLAMVDDGNGPHLALVNVGDSRAYLFVDGRLTQLTRDHSYVEDLVAAGEITPAQALTHPRRHIVTRALGVEPTVDVDVWQRPALAGERYLLCSDGLTNEVSDALLADVLGRQEPPQAIADLLVQLANDAGGRDNISVLVVDVVDVDQAGGASAVGGEVHVPAAIGGWLVGDLGSPAADPAAATGASARGGHDGDDSATPASVAAPPKPAASTGSVSPGPVVGTVGAVTTEAGLLTTKGSQRSRSRAARRAAGRAETARPTTARARPARPWVTPVRNIVTLLALAAIVVVVVGSIQAYGRSGYYVTFRNDRVTLYQGRPDGLLWVKPEAKLTYAASRSQLAPAWQDRIAKRISFTTRAAADRWYTLLSANPDAAPAIAPPATLPTTTTVAATTTVPPTTTVDPAAGVDPAVTTVGAAVVPAVATTSSP